MTFILLLDHQFLLPLDEPLLHLLFRYLAISINIALLDAPVHLVLINLLRWLLHQFGAHVLLELQDVAYELAGLPPVELVALIIVVLVPYLLHNVLNHRLVLREVHLRKDFGEIHALLIRFVLEQQENYIGYVLGLHVNVTADVAASITILGFVDLGILLEKLARLLVILGRGLLVQKLPTVVDHVKEIRNLDVRRVLQLILLDLR